MTNDGDRPLFPDSPASGLPFDGPIVRRRTAAIPAAMPAAAAAPRSAPPPAAPPVTSPAAPPQKPAQPRGVLIGRINGQVAVTKQPRHFFGLATLLGVSFLLGAAAILYATGGMLLSLLLLGVVAFVIVAVLSRFFLSGRMILVYALARAVFWVVDRFFFLVILAVRGGSRAARGAVRTSAGSWELTAYRFQVELISGEFLTCLMVGELAPGTEPRKDDHVGISGRQRKDHFAVSSLDVFSGPAGQLVRRAKAKPPLAFRVMRIVDLASLGLAVLVVAGVLAYLL